MEYDKKSEGKKAIEFCLSDMDQNQICLKDYKGKWIVLFFFDKTSLESPNSELFYYSRSINDFDKLNAHVIGVGPVSAQETKKFCNENDIKITILCDFDYKILEKYEVINYDKKGDKKVLPITFLINKDGIVSKIWNREKFYYRLTGYADNLIELWDQSKMWAHIYKVIDAIEQFEKKQILD